MMFYIFLSVFIFLIATTSQITNNLSKTFRFIGINEYLTVTVVFILVAVASFRVNSGFDYFNYYYIYTGKFDTPTEPLYELVQRLTRLTGSFALHLFIISLVSISIKVLFFYKSKVGNVCYALFIYYLILYLNADMGVIRQGVAIGFVALASIYFTQSTVGQWKALFFIAIASSFHVSAIIFIPILYSLRTVKVSSIRVILIYVLVSLLLMYVFIYSSDSLRGLIFLYGQKFSVYALENESAGLTLGVMLKTIFLILFYYFIVLNKKSTYLDVVFFKLYMIGIILFLIFNFFPIFSARIGNYFKIFEIVLVCRMITLSISRVNKIFFYILSIVWAYLQFYQFLSMSVVKKYYIPYEYNNFITGL